MTKREFMEQLLTARMNLTATLEQMRRKFF